MSVFVDTSALYALMDGDDASHAAAARAWPRLMEDGGRLLTTNYALIETSALVQHRLGLAALRALLDHIVPVLSVHWVTPQEHQAAAAAVLLANRKDLSLVDCVSFEVMRQLGVAEFFAYDRHFREQGFRAAGAGARRDPGLAQ